MKKCPTCGKEFEDSMRFCQIDGTPLVDDKPFDPYATIVGTVATMKPAPSEPEATTGASSTAIDVPEDVLEIPEADPMKTVTVSDAEMREVLETASAAAEMPAEEIKADALEAEVPHVAPPSFGDLTPPPSPFAAPGHVDEAPMRAPDVFEEAVKDPSESTTLVQPPEAPPQFETPTAAPVAEWTPPPAPDASWQNQEIGANTPFQPPPAGVAAGGQNKTLAIISMITGIVGFLCCSSIFIVGLAAIVLGFIANSKASGDPNAYGGKGMAWAGIILGFVSLLVGAIYWILIATGTLALPRF